MIRKTLRKVVDRLIRGNHSIAKIDELEKRLALNNALLLNTMPEVLPAAGKEQQNLIRKFKEKHRLNHEFNPNISKNDLMFMFQMYHSGADYTWAMEEYFNRGKLGADIVHKVTDAVYGHRHLRVLDFASGHGCVTRFLALDYLPDLVYASDIKSDAMAFIKTEFSVNTLLSDFNPDNFNPEERFDFIFVSSLFTHLPEDLFKRWLVKLYALLSRRGCILFSVHNTRLLKTMETDFLYRKNSEDQLFRSSKEAITDTDMYGETFVSDTFLKDLFTQMGVSPEHYKFFGQVYWIQDLVLISKTDLVSVSFPQL